MDKRRIAGGFALLVLIVLLCLLFPAMFLNDSTAPARNPSGPVRVSVAGSAGLSNSSVSKSSGPRVQSLPLSGSAAPSAPSSEAPEETAGEAESGGAIEGTVVVGNSPAASVCVAAEMHVIFTQASPVRTDGKGYYRIPLAAGDYSVSVTIPLLPSGERTVTREAVVEKGLSTRVDFFLSQGGNVIGSVLVQGEAPQRCEVKAFSLWDGTKEERAVTETDSGGAFSFVGLPEGDVTLQASAETSDGRRVVSVAEARVVEGDTTECDFDLTADSRISGIVLGIEPDADVFVGLLAGGITLPPRLTEESVGEVLKLEKQVVAWVELSASEDFFRLEDLDSGVYTVFAVQVLSVEDILLVSAVVDLPAGEEEFVTLDFTSQSEAGG